MTIDNKPKEGHFFIDEAIGLPKEEFDQIVAKFQKLDVSDMNMQEIAIESVKGCNPHDVMIGFKLATLMYENEGRL